MADIRTGNRSNLLFLLAALLIVILWVVLRSGWLSVPAEHRVITVYGYSSLDEVMTSGVFPAFRRLWQERTGEPLEIVATFAGSGDITRRILERYPAEVAILSSELDAAAAVSGARTWRQLPHAGVLARSPLVAVVREGNPHGVRSLQDLGRYGLDLVQGLPASSGATNLAAVAVYTEALRESGDSETARAALASWWGNVTIPVASAREARMRFEKGEGDAFVTYEHDVVGNPSRNDIAGEIVYPPSTFMAEPIVVKIDKNITTEQRPVVDAFTSFLWSEEAQTILAGHGFRRAGPEPAAGRPDLPRLEDSITLDSLGGAARVRREILEAVWKERILGEPAAAATDSERQ